MDETPKDQPESTDSAGGGPISQDDIDALISGDAGGNAGAASDESAGAEQDASSPAGEASGAISQDDIDALISGAGEAASEPAGTAAQDASTAAPDEHSAVSQDDIDAILETAASGGDAPPESSGSETGEKSEGAETEADERLDSLGRPFDETAAAMQAAIEEEAAAAAAKKPAAQPPTAEDATPFEMPELRDGPAASIDPKSVTMLNDVNLHVKLQLGRTRMLVEDVLKLGEGSVVELDKLAGDPVDVLINDRLIARGEVLVLNDVFCVRISEVLANDPHRVTT